MGEPSGVRSAVVGSLHSLMAEGLAGILRDEGCPDVRIALSPESLLEAANANRPDVIIIDGCMCGDRMSVVGDIVKQGHTVALVVSSDWSGTFLLEAVQAGVGGCLSYDEDPAKFMASIGLIAEGLFVMSRNMAQLVADTTRTMRHDVQPEVLSPREQQVAIMVAQGATNREIAEELFISEHTVKIHLGHILEKLNLRNRQQIAAYVADQGLIQDIRLQ